MLAEHHEHRDFDALAPAQDLPEDRSLRDGEAYVEADDHEHRAGKEGNPPSETEELFVGEPR